MPGLFGEVPILKKSGPYLVPISEKSGPYLVPFRDFFLVGPNLTTLGLGNLPHTKANNLEQIRQML